MYFQPTVIYRNIEENRVDSVLRYIGNRVLTQNKNFLCAITGQTGMGKSWGGIAMCEKYSKMFNIPFNVRLHVIHTLKQLLSLIRSKELEKNIRIGTPILFEEPQTEANSRDWQSESNKMLATLLSTFRNQRLVVFFSTPYLGMVDKQSRILFHGEFKVLGFDKSTGKTTIKPRFLEFNGDLDKFYYKKLLIRFAIAGKRYYGKEKVTKWLIDKASQDLLDEYEKIKAEFSVKLIEKLWNQTLESEKEGDKNKGGDDFRKVIEIYNKYGANYLILHAELPHLSPITIEKYINFIKRSSKSVSIGTTPT